MFIIIWVKVVCLIIIDIIWFPLLVAVVEILLEEVNSFGSFFFLIFVYAQIVFIFSWENILRWCIYKELALCVPETALNTRSP